MWPGNPFRHPAWIAAHAEVLEPDLTVERWGADPTDQAVTGHHAEGPLRLVGDRLSDRLDPPLDALREALAAAQARNQAVLLHRLPEETARQLEAMVPAATVTTVEASPTVLLADVSWDDYLVRPESRRSRRIVAQAVRTRQAPEMSIAIATAPEEVGPALDDLVRLHHQRFGEQTQSFEPAKQACIATAIGPMAADGAATVRTLLVDEQPVAAMLVLTGDRAMWFHQSGWDPSFADRSVGRALLVDALHAACAQDLDFHLLCGRHEYKDWWANADRPVATLEVARW